MNNSYRLNFNGNIFNISQRVDSILLKHLPFNEHAMAAN